MSLGPPIRIEYVYRDRYGGLRTKTTFRTTEEAEGAFEKLRRFPDPKLERAYLLDAGNRALERYERGG